MKIKYKEKFEKLYEEATIECDRVPIKDTYTEVYMIKGCTGGVNTKHEVRQVEDFYPKTEETPITLSDLFKVQSTENKHGTKVLTLGIAGVGKTVSVHKFILDWAEQKCNQDIDFIIYLPFRELNLIKDEILSGCGLMEESCKSLTSVLQTENSLKELEMNNNDLQNSGVEQLCAGMKSSHCKLEIL
ncbi:hypothetical protein P4O66_003510 [Electrophorus voltai]|uniref:FISNA domain-containing protein n=1 Tax=Electrophorus voltai TaxID=2609070 RepID=A0AAD9DLM3_9TELE|nr:hypothetical protein P4O66_003510 [Electrophorus voltai]